MAAPRASTNNQGLQEHFDALSDYIDSKLPDSTQGGLKLEVGRDFTTFDSGDDGMTIDVIEPPETYFFMWRLIPIKDKMYVWTRGHVHAKFVDENIYRIFEPKIGSDDEWQSIWRVPGTPLPYHTLPLSTDSTYVHWMVIDPNDQGKECRLYILEEGVPIEEEAEVEGKADIHIFKLNEFDTNSSGYPAFTPESFKMRSDIIICCETSPSSVSESDESGPGESGPESNGESKDTAIVPVSFYDTGFAALYVVESPNVEFQDVSSRWIKGKRRANFPIDQRYLEVVEESTIRVVVSGDSGWAAGYVSGGRLYVTTSCIPWERPQHVTFFITGIRKGFAGTRFGKRDQGQFERNEKRLKEAY